MHESKKLPIKWLAVTIVTGRPFYWFPGGGILHPSQKNLITCYLGISYFILLASSMYLDSTILTNQEMISINCSIECHHWAPARHSYWFKKRINLFAVNTTINIQQRHETVQVANQFAELNKNPPNSSNMLNYINIWNTQKTRNSGNF